MSNALQSETVAPRKPQARALMSAGVIEGPGRVRIARVATPEPGAGQVRVRLEGCGVCGSNLPPWEGRPWFTYPLAPGELGHEGWGKIDALGPGVNGLRIGDRVALLSYRAYAEYDLALAHQVVQLPKSLDGKPFPGEALGCALNVFRRSGVRPGQAVAIVGIGFLGAVLTALCVQAGARVIAISRRPFALQLARQLGAAEAIPICSADPGPIVKRVSELTCGKGCPRVIEAVGLQWPLDLGTQLTSERGRLIIAGFHQEGSRQVNMQLWNWRGIDVINAHEREAGVYLEGIRASVAAVASGKPNIEPLYTHRFALGDLSHALDAMKNRPENFLKAIVEL